MIYPFENNVDKNNGNDNDAALITNKNFPIINDCHSYYVKFNEKLHTFASEQIVVRDKVIQTCEYRC